MFGRNVLIKNEVNKQIVKQVYLKNKINLDLNMFEKCFN